MPPEEINTTINTTWLVVSGTAVMLILLFTIIFFVLIHQRRVIQLQMKLQESKVEQQNQLVTAAIQSQEAERRRISTELHDEVGALLSTIKLYLNQIQPEHFTNETKVPALNNCKDLLDETVKTIRDISVNLQPAIIKNFGLEGAVQNFIDKLKQSNSVNAILLAETAISRFDAEKELAVFRIIQELTNNILKHANAQNINYALVQKSEDMLQVFIEHNGNGLTQQEFEEKLYSKEGLGLKNIQNRVNILKAILRFQKNSGYISNVSLLVPISD